MSRVIIAATMAIATPIEGEANVDARRAEMGLGTLEEYHGEFREPMETP